MSRWHVRGLVAGPALPDGNIKLGRACRIGRIAERESRQLLDQANRRIMDLGFLAGQFGSPTVFSAEMPLTARVHSTHELIITVDALNDPGAFNQAEEEAGRHLGALALAVGVQRYRFYPSVAIKLPGPGGIDTRERGSTGTAMATVYESERLRVDDANYARALLELGYKDKVFQRAFGFLRAAWRLRDVPLDDPAILKAVLFNCFLVLETISDAVTRRWREENKPATLSQQGAVADDLREQLNATEEASKKVATIREAHKELQRADRQFQDLKLQTAGQILSIEGRFISLARELNKLRNTRLGHAGSTGSEELGAWIYKSNDPRLREDPGHFGKGELTAMAFLKAYVAYAESP
jgi:hypothetical protein